MVNLMEKKNYDLTQITRMLLEVRDNCVPKDGEAYDDPKREEKYEALKAVIDLINNPSQMINMPNWISVEEQLPPPETERYLVVSIYQDIRNVETAIWSWNENEEQGEWIKWGIVTHWMPLPNPPEEES